MKIKEKFLKRQSKLNNPLPVIAFIGDSVTQGCFECFVEKDGSIETVYHPELAYSRLLLDKLLKVYDRVTPVIINAGISGDNAKGILSRLSRDVLPFKPDLTIVSTGLNDSLQENPSAYGDELKKIFSSLLDNGSEVIFLTENMMCTYVPDYLTDPILASASRRCARIQNQGMLDKYFDTAKAVASEFGVRVCDCYSIWKDMAKNGVDTTALLINGMNHPTPEMLEIFADELLKIILD